eukprot:TRINITY_DN4488_c0_g1_i1.p1 TRINITY_DN4488_c0_g1~~TRINITY_DN4488_c0_g1_i1.p1  ORF type:complete len:650 (+),score=129.86 TRINITY_DN4488_c0_g1_i1:1102-3051(+)
MAEVTGPFGKLNTDVSGGKGVFTLTYYPTHPGEHRISVHLFGKDVSPKPSTVKVEALTNLNIQSHHFVGQSNVALMNRNTKFICKIVQKNGHALVLNPTEFDARLKGPKNTILTAKVTSEPGSLYAIEFVADKPGKYALWIVAKGNLVVKDHNVNVSKPAHPSHCLVDGITNLIVNLEHSFRIIAKDNGGAKLSIGGEHFEVILTHDKEVIKVDVQDLQNGEYQATFTPHHVGTYSVNILLSGVTLSGLPTNIYVKPDFKLKYEFSGDGLHNGIVSTPTVFDIHVKDSSGKPYDLPNVFDIKIQGHDSPPVESNITVVSPGHFRVEYTGTRPGDYNIIPSAFGEPIHRNPIVAHLKGVSKLKNITLEGPGAKQGYVKQHVEFFADLLDNEGKPLVLPEDKITGIASCQDSNINCRVTIIRDGYWKIEWVPTFEGEWTIELLSYDKPLGYSIKTTILPEESQTESPKEHEHTVDKSHKKQSSHKDSHSPHQQAHTVTASRQFNFSKTLPVTEKQEKEINWTNVSSHISKDVWSSCSVVEKFVFGLLTNYLPKKAKVTTTKKIKKGITTHPWLQRISTDVRKISVDNVVYSPDLEVHVSELEVDIILVFGHPLPATKKDIRREQVWAHELEILNKQSKINYKLISYFVAPL